MKTHNDRVKRPSVKRAVLVLAAAGVLLVAAAGSTLAWLGAQSTTLSNRFDPAKITCDIDENFSGGVKSDVKIQNTGTIDAYIRVALIPVWKDGANIAGAAASLDDCTIDWGDAVWARGADGFYYCKKPIPAGAYTPILIDECTADSHDGYQFELQISAQAIQALPASAVKGVWDSVTGVAADGTLEVMG